MSHKLTKLLDRSYLEPEQFLRVRIDTDYPAIEALICKAKETKSRSASRGPITVTILYKGKKAPGLECPQR